MVSQLRARVIGSICALALAGVWLPATAAGASSPPPAALASTATAADQPAPGDPSVQEPPEDPENPWCNLLHIFCS